VRLSRPHELSPDLERMLIDRGPAVANWSRLSEETLAALTAKVGRETLSLSEVLNRMSDADGTRRKQAAQALAKSLAERTATLARCVITRAWEKQLEDRWRKYPTPAASRHIANEVHADAVAALEAAVVEAFEPVSHRYYRL
jgi:oligoendopeptidase F